MELSNVAGLLGASGCVPPELRYQVGALWEAAVSYVQGLGVSYDQQKLHDFLEAVADWPASAWTQRRSWCPCRTTLGLPCDCDCVADSVCTGHASWPSVGGTVLKLRSLALHGRWMSNICSH